MIKSLFYFFTLTLLLPLSINSNTTTLLSQQLKGGKYCVGQDLFDKVKHDINAVTYYVKYICSQYSVEDAKKRMTNVYGKRLKTLGSGSFGNVYQYKKADKSYAIKVPKNFDYKDVFRELNASECIKEKLNDSSALKYMGFITECLRPTKTAYYMIMDFLPMNLSQYINKMNPIGWTHLDSTKKSFLIRQMLRMVQTIEAMHAKNMVHRDIKPDNIMINSKSVPIVVDFGLLTPMGDLARTMGGTPYYVDYEMVNEVEHGKSVDIYSLLATFAFMVHGGMGGKSVLDNVLKNGKYLEATKRFSRTLYSPKFRDFKMPSEFSWMNGMFIPKKSGRMTATQVVQEFKRMLGEEVDQKLQQPELKNQATSNQIGQKAEMVPINQSQKPVDDQKILAQGEMMQKFVPDAKNPYIGLRQKVDNYQDLKAQPSVTPNLQKKEPSQIHDNKPKNQLAVPSVEIDLYKKQKSIEQKMVNNQSKQKSSKNRKMNNVGRYKPEQYKSKAVEQRRYRVHNKPQIPRQGKINNNGRQVVKNQVKAPVTNNLVKPSLQKQVVSNTKQPTARFDQQDFKNKYMQMQNQYDGHKNRDQFAQKAVIMDQRIQQAEKELEEQRQIIQNKGQYRKLI